MKLDEDNIVLIELRDIEQWDNELVVAKDNRNLVEYYFTLSPILPLYVLEKFQGIDIVTYLDADLMFFASPEVIYNELGDASILITSHRFPPALKHFEKYGKFNVQYQAFRNDKHGRSCMEKWRYQCLDWCYDRLDATRFADQKYLDEWPELYGGHLIVSNHPGVGVAPWNVVNSGLVYGENGCYISGKPLIFYHYSGLKFLSKRMVKTGMGDYIVSRNPDVRRLYISYVGKLAEAERAAGEECTLDARNGYGKLRTFIHALCASDLMLL